jgi:hypothetical protein
MKAIVQVNYRDMKGNSYQVNEIVSNRVTLEYNSNGQTILVDFNLDEVQIVFARTAVFRNQGWRDGRFVEYINGKGYVIAYDMPNGKTFKNILSNPFKTSEYKTFKA